MSDETVTRDAYASKESPGLGDIYIISSQENRAFLIFFDLFNSVFRTLKTSLSTDSTLI